MTDFSHPQDAGAPTFKVETTFAAVGQGLEQAVKENLKTAQLQDDRTLDSIVDGVSQQRGPKQQRHDGNGNELRSSSGECTSGESNTDKLQDRTNDRTSDERPGSAGGREAASGSKGSGEPSSTHLRSPGPKQQHHHHQQTQHHHHGQHGHPPAATRGGQQASGQASGGGEPTKRSAAKAEAREAAKEKRQKLPRPTQDVDCPRCGSDDTKFCYYNNYNIKQPRHFCKACQRYWTEGGTLRNVPVGAGRRKKKSMGSRPQDSGKASTEVKQSSSMDGAFPSVGPLQQQQQQIGQQAQSQQTNPWASSSKLVDPFAYKLQLPTLGPFGPIGFPAGELIDNRLLANSGAVLDTDSGLMMPTPQADDAAGNASKRPRRDSAFMAPGDGQAFGSPELLDTGKLGNQGFQPFQNATSQAVNGGVLGSGPSGGYKPTPQQDWLNMAAVAGQQQAVVQQAAAQAMQQQAQQQMQQAAVLQAQAQLQGLASAAGWGQTQNPYLPTLWPYPFYGAGPNWATAAAYARLGGPGWSPHDMQPGTAGSGQPGMHGSPQPGGIPAPPGAGVGGQAMAWGSMSGGNTQQGLWPVWNGGGGAGGQQQELSQGALSQGMLGGGGDPAPAEQALQHGDGNGWGCGNHGGSGAATRGGGMAGAISGTSGNSAGTGLLGKRGRGGGFDE